MPRVGGAGARGGLKGTGGRGLHSSTSHLNVSTFCGTRWVASVYMLVIIRHRLDKQRLTDNFGLG